MAGRAAEKSILSPTHPQQEGLLCAPQAIMLCKYHSSKVCPDSGRKELCILQLTEAIGFPPQPQLTQ